MATVEVKTQSELYEIFRTEVESRDETLTDWEEGAINDTVGGATSIVASEIQDTNTRSFNKTFFKLAEGDDLEALAIDHFGDDFERPDDVQAEGIAKFERPTVDAGTGTIPAGTIVKTETDVNGQVVRYETILDVTMSGLSVSASIIAVEGGTKGNQDADTVTVIESTLFDATITVTNEEAITGGEAEQDDPTYLQTIYRKIQELGKATKVALRAAALNVPGVENAAVTEVSQVVIGYDLETELTEGSYFRIPRTVVYIADANGTASTALIARVQTAIDANRAAGVRIRVQGASPITIDAQAAITLNPSGPNYTALSEDPSEIEETMADYINALDVGVDFNRALFRAAILAIWGPDGTNDLTEFEVTAPSGNVSIAANEKPIPGDMEVV